MCEDMCLPLLLLLQFPDAHKYSDYLPMFNNRNHAHLVVKPTYLITAHGVVQAKRIRVNVMRTRCSMQKPPVCSMKENWMLQGCMQSFGRCFSPLCIQERAYELRDQLLRGGGGRGVWGSPRPILRARLHYQ